MLAGRRTKTKCGAFVLLATALPVSAHPAPKRAAPPAFTLERVVMVMRHGIRPPTKPNSVPAIYSADTWPSWPVGYGLLTPRGAAGVRLLGANDRAYYASRGLFGAGCPADGTVLLKASGKQRAIRTAESWAEGFMPGCKIGVAHPGEKDLDPVFHGLDDEPTWFDGQRAHREAVRLAPRGGIQAEARVYKSELTLLARVLGCSIPHCRLLSDRNALIAAPHDRPDLEGPLDVGSTASQTLLLEYLEGMPMKDVGWGRVTRAQIERLLRFHPLKFKYSNRPDYVARAAGAPLAGEIVEALTAPGGTRITVLAGHDTNIADLGGFFKVHWRVPSYPADDVPPGSAIGFEMLRDIKGRHYVRAFFRAQTMDQLRFQRPLTGNERPHREYLALPDCGASAAARACTIEAFQRMIAQRQPQG